MSLAISEGNCACMLRLWIQEYPARRDPSLANTVLVSGVGS